MAEIKRLPSQSRAQPHRLSRRGHALDEENERFLYEKLRASGIAFVSVGHRSTLKEFHDRLLLLKNDGTSEIAPIPKSGSAQSAAKV